MTKLLETPPKFFLGLGEGVTKPNHPNNKNESLIELGQPRGSEVQASSGKTFSLKFTSQHQMIVFL